MDLTSARIKIFDVVDIKSCTCLDKDNSELWRQAYLERKRPPSKYFRSQAQRLGSLAKC